MSKKRVSLIAAYERSREKYGSEAYKYISQTLKDVKKEHRAVFSGIDHEQSWRAFKGKNLEKLIHHIIKEEVKELGLEIVNGSILERTLEKNLSEVHGRVKRNLLIDYGRFGYHLPDVDLILYDEKTMKVVGLISSKVTLRERIAQTGYWKLKLLCQPDTLRYFSLR